MCKKTLHLVCLFLLLFFLSGCWSSVEINNRTIVNGIYVDKGEKPGEVELTISNSLPNRLGSSSLGSSTITSKPPYSAVSNTGSTLAEAFARIQDDLTRTISWGHTRIIVVGKEYAKQGLKPLLEWILRQPTFHLNTFILVAPGKAKDLNFMQAIYEKTPAEVLREYGSQHFILSTTIHEMLVGYFTHSDYAISQLTSQKAKMASEMGQVHTWYGTDGAEIFHNDKLVGKVGPKEALMFAWMEKRLNSPTFIIHHGKNKNKISMKFRQLDTQIRPRVVGKKIHISVQLKGVGEILSADTKDNITDRKVIHQIEKETNQYLRKIVLSGLHKTQKKQSDALQLGRYVDWYIPNKWDQIKKNWGEYYSKQVNFEVKSLVYIKHYGAESRSINFK